METSLTSTEVYVSPFILDPEFKQGLESILTPLRLRNASADEVEEVTRRAETFFAQSKMNSNTTLPTTTATITETKSSEAPPYPLSFAALASLIASGAPIPGIRDIPNKLAEGEPSISTVELSKVKKPWEVKKVESEAME